MMSTMLVDLDHLLANPIYDSSRCSIGFHPLHQPVPISFYLLLSFSPLIIRFKNNISRNLQFIGLGLIIHMALDSIDCAFNTGSWIYMP